MLLYTTWFVVGAIGLYIFRDQYYRATYRTLFVVSTVFFIVGGICHF